jgi:hypothetical protein
MSIQAKLAAIEGRIEKSGIGSCDCHDRSALAFSDEPENVQMPFGFNAGVCGKCRQPLQTQIIPLSDYVTGIFKTVPWSADPKYRFLEKLTTVKLIGGLDPSDRDERELQRHIDRICDRADQGINLGDRHAAQ